MSNKSNNWLKPEDALRRFKKPENAVLNKPDYGFTEQSLRYGFIIENMGFLIAENTLSEVVKNTEIYPIPHTSTWMRGLINLRGNLVPIYDFSLLLGLSDKKTEYDNLLVLGNDSHSVGLLIDNIPKSYDIGNWQKLVQAPCQLGGLEDHVVDTYSCNDIMWLDFDHVGYFESIKEKVVS